MRLPESLIRKYLVSVLYFSSFEIFSHHYFLTVLHYIRILLLLSSFIHLVFSLFLISITSFFHFPTLALIFSTYHSFHFNLYFYLFGLYLPVSYLMWWKSKIIHVITSYAEIIVDINHVYALLKHSLIRKVQVSLLHNSVLYRVHIYYLYIFNVTNSFLKLRKIKYW